MSGFHQPVKLKKLLNSAESAQKNVIHDFTWGHLNESRLQKTKSKSDKCTSRRDTEQTLLKTSPRYKRNILEKSQSSYLGDFPTLDLKVLTRSNKVEALNKHESLRIHSSPSPSIVPNDVLIEEFMLSSPTNFLPSLNLPSEQHEIRTNVNERIQSSQQSLNHDAEILQLLKLRDYAAVPGSLHGFRKIDQYENKLAYIDRYLKDKSCHHSDADDCKVDHIMEELLQELAAHHGCDEDFMEKRLCAYRRALNKLINSSPMFGQILYDIQRGYEEYIEHMMRTLHSTSHHELVEIQVHQLMDNHCTIPGAILQRRERLHLLEQQAEDVLKEHARLKTEIIKESTQAPLLDPDTAKSHPKPKIPIADEIEHLKSLILEKLDKIKEINDKKLQSVSVSVCSHLENCIMDTQIELQKMLKQNDFFQTSIDENEELLKQAILASNTSDKDARWIWDQIDSLSDKDVRNEVCDDSKWSWYIS